MPTLVGAFGEAATGSAIGVPSKLGTYRKCRLQGRHFVPAPEQQ
jgi:hypothetical protein